MQKVTYKNTNQNNPQIQSYVEAMEKGKNSQHVLLKNGFWIVKGATPSNQTVQTFKTQAEARKHAEIIAINQGTTLFIHGKSGRIIDQKEY